MAELAFTRHGYRQLLQALRSGGYTPAHFDEEPEKGDRIVYLRHDVDKRPAAARRMAEIETKEGWSSTFFFLLRAPLYSVLEPTTLEEINAVADLGHRIGLHCDPRRMMPTSIDTPFDDRVEEERALFERVVGLDCTPAVSFHNPDQHLIGRDPVSSAYVSTYAPRFMPPETKYLSESNARWREGDPLRPIREGRWERLQLLVHPIWWDAESVEPPRHMLKDVFDNRRNELDAYLRWTNDLWNSEGSA